MKLKNWAMGILGGIVLSAGIWSCSSSDNPFDIKESFAGDFIGEVEYRSPQDSVILDNGWVTVVYQNGNHQLHFPENIPSLLDIEFEDNGETLMNVDADSLHLIRVTDASLIVVFQNEETEESWTAKCLRK